jgi:catalase
VTKLHAALLAQGAVPRWVAPRLGAIVTADGSDLQADASLENEPGFLFDALVLPDGAEAVKALARDAHTMEFIRDHYRHCKSIVVFGASKALLRQAGVPEQLAGGAPDPGLVVSAAVKESEVDSAISSFLKAIARHRHPERDTDPPAI